MTTTDGPLCRIPPREPEARFSVDARGRVTYSKGAPPKGIRAGGPSGADAANEMPEIPQKRSYKGSEVCQYTGTQPYMLRFWASEFPQLRPEKSRTGQPIYSRADIDLILRIKSMLYDEEFTIAAARRRLDEESKGGARRRGGSASAKASPVNAPQEEAGSEERAPAEEPQAPLGFGSVPRERYDDAVDEIAHLRLQLREAETRLRMHDSAMKKAETAAAEYRALYEKAIDRLEQLLEILD